MDAQFTDEFDDESHVQVCRGRPCKPWTSTILDQISEQETRITGSMAYSAIGSTDDSGSYGTVKPVLFTFSTLNLEDYIEPINEKIFHTTFERERRCERCGLTMIK